MRILVLGPTGYLGRQVDRLLRRTPGTAVLTGGRAPGADVPADLAADSADGLARALAEAAPDAVVNCAGAVGGDPVTLAEVNARGPALLCAALRRAAPGARLVHLGSAAEYGPGPAGVRTPETAPAAPVTPYGATKLAGTVAVTAAGLDAVVLRVGNPVGPGAPAAGLPGRVARLLREAGPDPAAVIRLGDLSPHRDFVDARDVARAAVLAATVPGPLPPVLNVGGGAAVPVRELVTALTRVAGFPGRVAEASGGSARSGGVAWQCSDITAADRALGWRPEHTLAESAAALWAEAADPDRGVVAGARPSGAAGRGDADGPGAAGRAGADGGGR